jgi:hypothetical protein
MKNKILKQVKKKSINNKNKYNKINKFNRLVHYSSEE